MRFHFLIVLSIVVSCAQHPSEQDRADDGRDGSPVDTDDGKATDTGTGSVDDTGSGDPCASAATTDIDDVPEADRPDGTAEAIAGVQSLVGSWVAYADCHASDAPFKWIASVDLVMEADTHALLLFDRSSGCQKIGVLPLSYTSSEIKMGPRTLRFDATFDAYVASPELVDARFETPSKEFVHEEEHPASTAKAQWETEWIHLELRDSLFLEFGYVETYDIPDFAVLSYGGHCAVSALTPAK